MLPALADGLLARTTLSQEDGLYEFANLPPGEYRVAAWQGVSPGIAQYRGLFAPYTSTAQSVNLGPGKDQALSLVAIGVAPSEEVHLNVGGQRSLRGCQKRPSND